MKLKLTKKTAQKILKWSWNIIFLYALAAITLIIIDANNNPEIYNKESDCKPLVNLLDKFDKYVSPVWPSFIILVIISWIINYWNKIQKDKNKILKVCKFIRTSLWNLIFVYAVVVGFLIVNDSNSNPELYYAIGSRPQSIQGTNIYISIIPEWHYKASTIQECKPMINLLDKFDKYVSPVWPAFIIVVVASLLVDSWGLIKRVAKKFEENQEDD